MLLDTFWGKCEYVNGWSRLLMVPWRARIKLYVIRSTQNIQYFFLTIYAINSKLIQSQFLETVLVLKFKDFFYIWVSTIHHRRMKYYCSTSGLHGFCSLQATVAISVTRLVCKTLKDYFLRNLNILILTSIICRKKSCCFHAEKNVWSPYRTSENNPLKCVFNQKDVVAFSKNELLIFWFVLKNFAR